MMIDPVRNYSSKQISCNLENNKFMLAVIVKRTYSIDLKGNCLDSVFQSEIKDDISFYEDNLLLFSDDIDSFPFKYKSDFIIKGKARPFIKTNKFISEIFIAKKKITYQYFGKRLCYKNHYGKLTITEPELVDEIPLRYDFAYGGKDLFYEDTLEKLPEEILKLIPKGVDTLQYSPYRYPRNPLGKGYIVDIKNNNNVEPIEMPNIEDPLFLITPQNIEVKNPNRWPLQPLPKCTDFIDHLWFPRKSYFGLYDLTSFRNFQFEEILKNLIDESIFDIMPLTGSLDLKCTNGASLDLQFPYLDGNEEIKLINIHPTIKEFILQLPGDRPKIWVDGRNGTLKPTTPVIHTIVIEPDEGRLSIVWRGSAPALRPYMDEELKTMPFKVEW